MMSHPFIDKVYAFTEKKCPLWPSKHVVVALSGGADSMALLNVLLHWPKECLKISAVHVHHGLRGEFADRDEKFVRDYCASHNVELLVFHEDVAAFAQENGLSLEEAGRRVRYLRFEEARERLGAHEIVTAHTASDRAETVLMRIIRGTGVDGLNGIAEQREYAVRPLLSCTRGEVEAFCAECGIPFVTDETNEDVAFTRNRIRHQVMPLLRELNPAVDEALLRLANHAGEDTSVLFLMARRQLEQGMVPYGYAVSAFLDVLPSIRHRMILHLLRAVNVPSFEETHVLAAEKALLDGKGDVHLSGGFVFSVSQGVAAVRCASNDHFPVPILCGSPIMQFGDWTIEFSGYRKIADPANVHNLFSNDMLDRAKIQGNLYLRCRREGDTIHPAGRGVGKTIKKLMNEYRIPAYLRDTYPLLCDDLGVVMVPGYAVDERVRIADTTKDYLVCRCEKTTH